MGWKPSRSPAIASRENRDYQRATGPVYRASFSTGGYRRLTPGFCRSPVVSLDSFSAPALIARAGPTTRKKFFEFFTVPIRNANTRAAYYRAIQQFLAWAERAGYQDLEGFKPLILYITTDCRVCH